MPCVLPAVPDPKDLHQGCPADLRGLFSLMTLILQVIPERATILSAESAYGICAHLRESFPAARSVSQSDVSEKVSVMDVAIAEYTVVPVVSPRIVHIRVVLLQMDNPEGRDLEGGKRSRKCHFIFGGG